MHTPPTLERLIAELAKLPGIGKKTAQRLAYGILRYSRTEAENLAQAVMAVKEQIRHCSRCHCFTEQEICSICSDPQREAHILCVVEQPYNILPIENSSIFKGLYHVLLGAVTPMDGIGPDQLTIPHLKHRIENDQIEELILATNPSVQGEATALYIQHTFASMVPRITRLARGLPAGGDLEFVDNITLIEAFSGRKPFS